MIALRPLARRARDVFASRAALGRRLFALGAALLVLVSTLTAGRSYLWCAMMERTVEVCCCDPAPEGDEAPGGGAQIRAACCEDHALADLDKARVAAASIEVPDAVPIEVAAAPVIFTPGPAPAFAPPRSVASARGSPIRAGPLRAADTCVRLQVFRC